MAYLSPLQHWSPAGRRLRWPALVIVIALLACEERAIAETPPAPMRIAFSNGLFNDVNESDVQASLKTWALLISREVGVPISEQVPIFKDVPSILKALRTHQLDAITVTTPEYWIIHKDQPSGPIVLSEINQQVNENYLLLVHRDSPYRTLEDLRGKKVGYQIGARLNVAATWLETRLLEQGLGTASEFWGTITQSGKLTRIVLPVFFRQADACVTSASGFATMCELNPQVKQQLRILEHSPPLCPVVFFFRSDYQSVIRDTMLAKLDQISRTPAGRQALALFLTDNISVHSTDELEPTFQLLDRHEKLLRKIPPREPPTP